MKKTWKRIITLLLAAVMTMESGVAEVFAAAIDYAVQSTDQQPEETNETSTDSEQNASASDDADGADGTETSGEIEESYIIGENLKKRDQYTKHFLTESGDYIAVMYPEPVHYEKDGEWLDIDNTLVLADGADTGSEHYENSASGVDISISRYSDSDELVSIETEEGRISWTLAETGEESSQEGSAGETSAEETAGETSPGETAEETAVEISLEENTEETAGEVSLEETVEESSEEAFSDETVSEEELQPPDGAEEPSALEGTDTEYRKSGELEVGRDSYMAAWP